MRRLVRVSVLAGMALALCLLLVGTAYAGDKVTKSTGKDAAVLSPAFEVFPGTVYDSTFTKGYAGAKGKVNVVQPNGNVDVIIAVSADGLKPSTRYLVYFDTDGITENVSSAGPWTLKGDFWSDEYGQGEWNYTAPAGSEAPGSHTLSVFINEAGAGRTMLISENIEYTIEETP